MWNARKLAAAHAARFEWKRSAEQRSASERKYEWLDTYISGSQPTVLGLLEVQASFAEMKVRGSGSGIGATTLRQEWAETKKGRRKRRAIQQ